MQINVPNGFLDVPCDASAGTRGRRDTWETNAGTNAVSLIHGDE